MAGRSVKGAKPGGCGQLCDAFGARGGILTKEAAEEVQVLPHREAGVEVTPESLGHVGDAVRHRIARAALPQVAPQDLDPTRLDLAHPCDDPEQGRLAHPVRPDQPAHPPGGQLQPYPIERGHPAVGVAYPTQSDGGTAGVLGHGGSLGVRCSGQGVSGLTCT